MKFSLQNAAFLALFIAKASAAGSGIFAANGVELEVRNFDSDTMIGEPTSLIEARRLDGRDTNACTNCVGHHGSCTVGEGNCNAPDGCYFCGDCGVNEARCQNPKSEGCQCYK